MLEESQFRQIEPRHYRNVLGHFATGIAAVTAINDGTPVGMVVNAFTAVSINPPLVAFLPEKGSSTFPLIRESGRYCINVLAGGQEELCRRFAAKGADRFRDTPWRPAEGTGSPILEGAVAWIDCEIQDIHDAGDHLIVVGRVLDLQVQTPTLPLLFFQGGYGTFAPRSLVWANRGPLSEAVRMADAARETLEELATELGLECRVFAQEDDAVRIVASAGATKRADPVGAMLPFAPPYGYAIAAWGTPATRQAWIDALPGELSAAERRELDDALDEIRRHGWGVTFESAVAREAQETIAAMVQYGPTPELGRRLAAVSGQFSRLDHPGQLDEQTASTVRTMTAPVMGVEGAVLYPTLYGFPAGSDLGVVERARDALLRACAALSERFTGVGVGHQ